MKKILLPFLIVYCFSSCSSKIYPVQNNYAALPFTVKSNAEFDQVWDKLIDLFAQNGLSIKLIDRSSGLIVSDNSGVVATWENKEGNLVHPSADIVLPKKKNNSIPAFVPIVGNYPNKLSLTKPLLLRGEWNVRIKKEKEGTSINVNLVNVTYESTSYKGIPVRRSLTDYVSTGKFENSIAEIIK